MEREYTHKIENCNKFIFLKKRQGHEIKMWKKKKKLSGKKRACAHMHFLDNFFWNFFENYF